MRHPADDQLKRAQILHRRTEADDGTRRTDRQQSVDEAVAKAAPDVAQSGMQHDHRDAHAQEDRQRSVFGEVLQDRPQKRELLAVDEGRSLLAQIRQHVQRQQRCHQRRDRREETRAAATTRFFGSAVAGAWFELVAQRHRAADGPVEIPLTDGEHQPGHDQADLPAGAGISQWRARRLVDQVLDRDQVLNFRRPGRCHRERDRPERDRRRNELPRQVGLAKQVDGERIDREADHEQRHAAVGQQGARQDDGQTGAVSSQPAAHRVGDGDRRSRLVHQLSEHRPQREDQVEPPHVIGKPVHVRATHLADRIHAAQDRDQQRTERRHNKDALAANNQRHQQTQAPEQHDEMVGVTQHGAAKLPPCQQSR